MVKKTLGFLWKLVVTYLLVAMLIPTFHSITHDFVGFAILTIPWAAVLSFGLWFMWRPK